MAQIKLNELIYKLLEKQNNDQLLQDLLDTGDKSRDSNGKNMQAKEGKLNANDIKNGNENNLNDQ